MGTKKVKYLISCAWNIDNGNWQHIVLSSTCRPYENFGRWHSKAHSRWPKENHFFPPRFHPHKKNSFSSYLPKTLSCMFWEKRAMIKSLSFLLISLSLSLKHDRKGQRKTKLHKLVSLGFFLRSLFTYNSFFH